MAKDLCILCGKETTYDFETHIDYRVGYIEGAGQLCHSCYTNQNERELITIPKHFVKKYPNNYELGENVRSYYYRYYEDEKPQVKNTMVCDFCGKDTSDVDSDYLIGKNHLECSLTNPDL